MDLRIEAVHTARQVSQADKFVQGRAFHAGGNMPDHLPLSTDDPVVLPGNGLFYHFKGHKEPLAALQLLFQQRVAPQEGRFLQRDDPAEPSFKRVG